MTSVGHWVEGARPRTLGAAVAPVLVGTAVASVEAAVAWDRAAAALVVALALQVGVNYANDYSDGVRGTDRDRQGPRRLVAAGLATPTAVRSAAAVAFATAVLAGTALAVAVDPRLLLVGAVAVAAAVGYTGGSRPYGYSGWGELVVLVFFGFVATTGSAYVQLESVPAIAWWCSLVVGLPACGILLANNLRDVDSDRRAGKRTLVVRVGPELARRFHVGLLASALVAVVPVAVVHPRAAIAFLAAPLALRPALLVLTRSDPPSLVSALVGTARFQLGVAVLLAAGLAWS